MIYVTQFCRRLGHDGDSNGGVSAILDGRCQPVLGCYLWQCTVDRGIRRIQVVLLGRHTIQLSYQSLSLSPILTPHPIKQRGLRPTPVPLCASSTLDTIAYRRMSIRLRGQLLFGTLFSSPSCAFRVTTQTGISSIRNAAEQRWRRNILSFRARPGPLWPWNVF